MYSMQSSVLPIPPILKKDIECVRIIKSRSDEEITIHVSPGGVPGIVFHQSDGHPALEQIITNTGGISCPPCLFIYGSGIEPSVMRYKKGSSTTLQVVFKPHALKTLLGINATQLSNGWAELHEFGAGNLEYQLLEARNEQELMTFLSAFLTTTFKRAKPRDMLVEESLHLIHNNPGSLHVKDLLDSLHISERQFERRFIQTVGLSPHLYLRVKRFNEAIRLIKSGRFERLTDVAAVLNFSDQAHFIRDIKAFSGMTPKGLSQKVDDFYDEQIGYSFA